MNNRKTGIKSLEEEKAQFDEAKNQYAKCRGDQLRTIINYLEETAGFTVSPKKGGQGCSDYGARGRIPRLSTAYDLSNWKYIDCEKEGRKIFLSLQAFDQDPHSGNYHVLIDRIGIYIYPLGSNKTADAIDRMLSTDIDLPMDKDKLEKLADILNKIIDLLKQFEQMKGDSTAIASIEIAEDLKCLIPVIKGKSLLHQLSENIF